MIRKCKSSSGDSVQCKFQKDSDEIQNNYKSETWWHCRSFANSFACSEQSILKYILNTHSIDRKADNYVCIFHCFACFLWKKKCKTRTTQTWSHWQMMQWRGPLHWFLHWRFLWIQTLSTIGNNWGNVSTHDS